MAIYDFSEYQGTIDFGMVKNDAQLLILRVQAGTTHKDMDYPDYVAGCKANNIPFGTYAYAKFISVLDAVTEATNCYDRMDKATQFVVVDVESVSTTNPADLVPATQAFIDHLHSLGVGKVGLYSGEYFYTQNGLNNINADFLWIAKYGTNDGQPHTKPSTPCDLWQYSSVATVSGVVGNVDINELNGTKPLSYFTGGSDTVVTPPVKTVVVTGDGHGTVTITVDGANLYKEANYSGGVVRQMKKGDEYNYYKVHYGWYNLGSGWCPQQDLAVTSFTPNPVVSPTPSANQTVPPSANVSPVPSANTSAPAPKNNDFIVPIAQLIENAIMKDPQFQKTFFQKFFSFVASLFK